MILRCAWLSPHTQVCAVHRSIDRFILLCVPWPKKILDLFWLKTKCMYTWYRFITDLVLCHNLLYFTAMSRPRSISFRKDRFWRHSEDIGGLQQNGENMFIWKNDCTRHLMECVCLLSYCCDCAIIWFQKQLWIRLTVKQRTAMWTHFLSDWLHK